jgi:hypothetical protein
VVVESVEAVEPIFGGEPEQSVGSLGDGEDCEGIGVDAETVRSGGEGYCEESGEEESAEHRLRD